MQPIPLSVRIKALFTRDKEAFWWKHFTDEELGLRRMDVWELAKVVNEARVNNLPGEQEKLIVAEHLLNVRLAKIQATASWGSGALGFTGAIIGAALSLSLTIVLQGQKEAPPASVQKQCEQTAPFSKNLPSNPLAEVIPDTQSPTNGPRHQANTEHFNADTKL